QQLRNQQFLSPDGPGGMRSGHGHNFTFPGSNDLLGSQLPNLGAGMGLNMNNTMRRPSSVGHIRRGSSGSRSERGTTRGEGWGDDEMGPASGSIRASPYPSPN
ncbi:hypothetical protein MPER_13676, partial [Moniliophthora perniciosa FA553]